MASPAFRIPRSMPRSHRRPLHPKNLQANIAASGAAIIPKRPNPTILHPIQECAEKENREISNFFEEMELFPVKASFGEELEAALRRNREKAEAEVKDMDDAFERWMIDSERRLRELAVVEMELRRIVRAKERRVSCLRSSPFASLRAREVEKRWQTAQLQKAGNAAGTGKSGSVSGSMRSLADP